MPLVPCGTFDFEKDLLAYEVAVPILDQATELGLGLGKCVHANKI